MNILRNLPLLNAPVIKTGSDESRVEVPRKPVYQKRRFELICERYQVGQGVRCACEVFESVGVLHER